LNFEGHVRGDNRWVVAVGFEEKDLKSRFSIDSFSNPASALECTVCCVYLYQLSLLIVIHRKKLTHDSNVTLGLEPPNQTLQTLFRQLLSDLAGLFVGMREIFRRVICLALSAEQLARFTDMRQTRLTLLMQPSPGTVSVGRH
jgi:hypothetical protein